MANTKNANLFIINLLWKTTFIPLFEPLTSAPVGCRRSIPRERATAAEATDVIGSIGSGHGEVLEVALSEKQSLYFEARVPSKITSFVHSRKEVVEVEVKYYARNAGNITSMGATVAGGEFGEAFYYPEYWFKILNRFVPHRNYR